MATKVNLVIDQGADYTTTINLSNDDGSAFDLTGYTAQSKIKKHYTSSNATSLSVTLDGNTGIVTLTMNNATTSTMTAGRYVYDLELTDADGLISRIVEGTVTVTPQVTTS